MSDSKRMEEERRSRVLVREVRKMSAAQVVIAGSLVLAVCYVGKTVFVTLMVSILLAFVLAPVVSGLEPIRLPCSSGSLVAVLLLLCVTYGISYFLLGAILFT